MPKEAGAMLGLKVSGAGLVRCPVRTVLWCLTGFDCVSEQVVGGRITESGRLGAFITKVKKGSLADVVGHLRAGELSCRDKTLKKSLFVLLHIYFVLIVLLCLFKYC